MLTGTEDVTKAFPRESYLSADTVFTDTSNQHQGFPFNDVCPCPRLPLSVTLLNLSGEPQRGLLALVPAVLRGLCFSGQRSRKLSSALPFHRAVPDPPLLSQTEREKATAVTPGHSTEQHSQLADLFPQSGEKVPPTRGTKTRKCKGGNIPG